MPKRKRVAAWLVAAGAAQHVEVEARADCVLLDGAELPATTTVRGDAVFAATVGPPAVGAFVPLAGAPVVAQPGVVVLADSAEAALGMAAWRDAEAVVEEVEHDDEPSTQSELSDVSDMEDA